MDLVRSWACGEAPAVLQDKRSEEMNEQPCFCLQNRCCPFLCLWLTHTTDTRLTVPMRRAAASSIQGAVLVLGPADGLQAAAEGMPWYRECRGTGSQRGREADPQGEQMPELECASERLIPLPPVLCAAWNWHEIISLPTVVFALSPLCQS